MGMISFILDSKLLELFFLNYRSQDLTKEINTEETGENPPKDLVQDAETGTFSKVR